MKQQKNALLYWLDVNQDNVGGKILTDYVGALEDMPVDVELLEYAGLGRNILDFGCGIGRNTIALAKNFIEVVGYDLPNMIALIPENNKFVNITYTSDWKSLVNKKFDIIVAHRVFQAIPEKELRAFLKDMSEMTDKIIVTNSIWLDDTEDQTSVEILPIFNDYFNVEILKLRGEDDLTVYLTKK